MAPTSAGAVAAARPFLESKYGAYRRWEQDKALPSDDWWGDAFEDLARDRFLLGDPVWVREELARYRERLGVTTLIVRVQWPGMPQAEVLRSIRPARRAGLAKAWLTRRWWEGGSDESG